MCSSILITEIMVKNYSHDHNLEQLRNYGSMEFQFSKNKPPSCSRTSFHNEMKAKNKPPSCSRTSFHNEMKAKNY